MDPEVVVHDISSDEEEKVDCGENGKRGTSGVDNDYDWISELLEEVDKETINDDNNHNVDNDDDDDVVVVDEKDLSLNPKQRVKSSVKDLDDECVILDGDPDKPVEIENNSVDESDELLVVSEKGQVACRDYPHARHLCAKFPFGSSPHQTHCDQCHCYVCDSRVPCTKWGAGTSVLDHCHATDKDGYWVGQRKNTKKGDINQSAKPILIPLIDISLSTIQPPQINNQVPPLIRIEPNHVNQLCRPMPVRSNSDPNFSSPNVMNPNRIQRSGGYVIPRNKFQAGLSLHHQSHNGYNNVTRRCNTLGPLSVSPRQMFKRSGSFGSSTTNGHGYNPSNNLYRSNFSQNLPHPGQNPSRWQDFSSSGKEPSSYWANPSSGFTNHVPCQPNSGFGFVNSVPDLSHAAPLPNMVGCYASAVPPDSNVGPNYGNQDVYPQPYVSNCFEMSVPSQPHLYTQPISVSNDNWNTSRQESQSQGGPVYPSSSEFNHGWVDPSSQIKQTPVAQVMSLKGAAPIGAPLLPMEYNEQQIPNPNTEQLSIQYDNWTLNSQPVQSPELTPLDGGIFFDI